ncbi:MAG: arsenite methyltransferase [Ignavibacteria bacterium]|nr:arsenite methyltransferase [Ignavibacteria bacterium]
MENTELKEVVRNKYSEIAIAADKSKGCGCGCSSDSSEYSDFSENYKKLDGYIAEADLGLGCGLPTEYAGIKEGDIVVDLGSGAGNDVFVARSLVSENGTVVGIDFTDAMLLKANKNLAKLNYRNVYFKLGDIENLPLQENFGDVVISNCVLNLVPDKQKAFQEIYRTLKPGGHFCVSDIVTSGELPQKIRDTAALYAGCISGALKQEEYIGIITDSGFKDIEIKKSRIINLPDELLKDYLSAGDIKEFRKNGSGIFSITVIGYKK